jgi:membrane-associated protein
MFEVLLVGLIYKFPEWSPFFVFLALIIGGLNLPISEDAIIIITGFLAATTLRHQALELWISLFIGAFFSDLIAFSTGHFFGSKIQNIKWISKIVTPERLSKMHSFYEKWGFFAFFIGRFIPFGARNCLYISAGMGNMSFYKFFIIDIFAAFFSTTVGFLIVFNLSHYFGSHIDKLRSI